MHIDFTGVSPEVTNATIQLGEIAVRNTTSGVFDKIRAIKTKRNEQEKIAELEELVRSLLADKDDLLGIAETYKQELVAQQISPENIQYITESFIPKMEELIAQNATSDMTDMQKTLDGIKAVLSVEMLTVLQLVGFNFKRAIGEPLTFLVQKLITSRVPQDPQVELETNRINTAFSLELAKIAQDQAATERWEQVRRPPVY